MVSSSAGGGSLFCGDSKRYFVLMGWWRSGGGVCADPQVLPNCGVATEFPADCDMPPGGGGAVTCPGVAVSGDADAGVGARRGKRLKTARHTRCTNHMERFAKRCTPYTKYCSVKNAPAQTHITNTAAGQANQATTRRNAMRDNVAKKRQRVGNRQVRQKKKYEP